MPNHRLPAPKSKSLAHYTYEAENPRSIVSALPVEMLNRANTVPEELRNLPEEELEKLVPNPLGATGERLRKAMWAEYGRAMEQNTMMSDTMVYGAVCSVDTFKRYINDPKKMAWLMCPPEDYTDTIEDLLDRGLKRIKDILGMPVYTETGSPNTRVGELILKCVLALDMRARGAYTQRIEQKNLNINQNLPKEISVSSLEEVNKKIQLLMDREKELSGQTLLTAPDGSELVGLVDAMTVSTVGADGKEKAGATTKNPKAKL